MILSSFLRKKQQAFTLIEIIAVIVILSVLSSLAYVQYTRVRERTIAEDVKVDVLSIANAFKLWKIKTPQRTMSSTLSGVAALNEILGLNISDDYFDYTFSGSGNMSGYTVEIKRKIASSYTIAMTLPSNSLTEEVCCKDCPVEIFPPCPN